MKEDSEICQLQRFKWSLKEIQEEVNQTKRAVLLGSVKSKLIMTLKIFVDAKCLSVICCGNVKLPKYMC